jgi:hypothetical protein
MLFSIFSQLVGHVLVEVIIFDWMGHKIRKIRPSVIKWYNNKMYTSKKIYHFRKINFIFTMIENSFVCQGDYGDVRLVGCLEIRAVYFPAFHERICLEMCLFTFYSYRTLH